jgi:hypothetical protein
MNAGVRPVQRADALGITLTGGIPVAYSLLNDMPYREALKRLQAAWPDYHIWLVPLATGRHRFTWCARRDSDGQHHQCHTPGELSDYLSVAEAGRRK